MRYRENLDPVLHNISFEVKAREKIGIVRHSLFALIRFCC